MKWMCLNAAKQRPGELVNDNQVGWHRSGFRLLTVGPGSLSFVLLSLISSPWVLLYISVGSKHRLINLQLCILWFNLQAIQLNKLLKLCFLCNQTRTSWQLLKGDFIIYVFGFQTSHEIMVRRIARIQKLLSCDKTFHSSCFMQAAVWTHRHTSRTD